MIKVLAALVLACGLSASAFSQDSFMVMSVKGKAESSSSKGKTWKKLEIGQVLGKKDIVRTSFASYVKLMMNEQRLVSIDENTTKPLVDFVRGKSKSGEGSAGKILQYAAQQMSRTRQKRSGSDFGAVRGGLDVFSAVFPTHLIMNTTPRFEWIDSDSAGTYEVLVLDDQFRTIAKKQVQGLSFTLQNDGTPQLSGGSSYHWQLTRLRDGEIANVQTFMVVAADTAALVQNEVASLDRELSAMNSDDVTKHLIRAIYFERRGLYEDAYHEYKRTVRLAPEVEEYREMLRNLLVTMRLLNEEEYLMR